VGLIDARCTICGKFLSSWLTESGDNLCVQPCEDECLGGNDKFTTDEDFDEEEHID